MSAKNIPKDIKLTIVIVDDNPAEHFFIKNALNGFKNILYNDYHNGEDFLRFLEEKNKKPRPSNAYPDIVILDVNMPGMSGFEVFNLIEKKNLKSHTRFYILTTNITDAERENCKRFQLRCYKKPFDLDDFTELLEDIISHSIK
jgi:CheY-like chemotaxis protein